MLRAGKLGAVSVALLTLVFVGVLSWRDSATTLASPGGLLNPGFEDGLLNGLPVDWSPATPIADSVVVRDQDGSSFGTYADQGITVDPLIGNRMLRLGTPKDIRQKQTRGLNRVSQTFRPERDALLFSFWLFSWEHRGDDVFFFDLTDAAGAHFNVKNATTDGDLVLTMPDGSNATCPLTPCSFTVDVGKRGQFLNTGWVKVKLTGLPTNEDLTLTYSVKGGENEAHATWAYFDNVNTPPVASFDFLPFEPLEGDFIQFNDHSYDPDPGDSVVAWEWVFSGASIETHTSTQQNPIFVFPDEGTYSVCLTVTDSFGATDDVCAGELDVDGTLVPAGAVFNASMLENALNVEALASEGTALFGRFYDPGLNDSHTASFTVDGSPVVGAVDEAGTPLAGTVSGSFTAPAAAGPLAGSMNVQDDADPPASANDSFDVVVLSSVNSREPNDTIATAPALDSGWRYLSDITSPGDVDVFEITLPGGQPLPANSEALVTLGDLPADYDLVILSQLPEGLESAGYLSSGYLSSGYLSSGYLSSGYLSSGYLSSGYLSSGYLSSGYLSSGYLSSGYLSSGYLSSGYLSSPLETSPYLSPSLTFDQIPLSNMGFGTPQGNELGGTDVGLAELGLGAVRFDPTLSEDGAGPDTCNDTLDNGGDTVADGADSDCLVSATLVGYSVNRGLDEEKILVRTDFQGTRLFGAVVGHNGAFSVAPYSLQLETSVPLDLVGLLGDNCGGSALVTTPTSSVDTIYPHPGTDLTLFVTQQQRLQALYGLDTDAWNALRADLVALADHPAVAGDIISVPSVTYDDWDANPCSVDEANNVAAAIRSEIMTYLDAHPSIQYVVLVGNDDVIPYRRVPDEVSIGNESLYLLDSFLLPGTPLFSSVAGSNNLTDDFYVDRVPMPWQGREWYYPDADLSIGRLVETPAEISAAAAAFLFSDGLLDAGTLDVDTAVVSGYDFFNDGAQATADELTAAGLATDTLIRDDWTADDLRCVFLGEASTGLSGGLTAEDCAVHDVSNTNAHYTHYAALSADGFNAPQDLTDALTSAQVADAGGSGTPALKRTVAFTIGCHSALNVPDGDAAPTEFGLTLDPNLDFAQAMARQQAVYVGPTGFGLGDDAGIAGTERLMIIFAEEMADGGPIGQALVAAKLAYLNSLGAPSVYDEKSLIDTTLYGLPQYNVEAVAGFAAAVAAAIGPASLQQAGVSVGELELTIEDRDAETTTTTFHALTEETTADGSYVTADGDFQSTPGRAIVPRVVREIAPDANGPVHGVLLKAGTYSDTDDGDPVISTPVTEWNPDTAELQICLPAFWPSQLAGVNSLESGGELLQTLLFTPGQFRCTSGPAPTVTGTQRLVTGATLELHRSLSDDFQPPQISSVDLSQVDATTVAVNVAASDELSGMAEIVVLVIDGGTITSFGSGPLSGPGPYSVEIPNFPEGAELLVQGMDGAGNVTVLTAKGAGGFNLISVDAGPDQAYSAEAPTTLRATVFGFTDLLTKSDTVSFTWDLGDGSFASGPLATNGAPAAGVTVENGNAVFSVEHPYSGNAVYTATLKVTDAAGGVGVDTAVIRPCGEPPDLPPIVSPDADLVACGVDNEGTGMTITLTLAGPIPSDEQFQYRVKLDIGAFDANRQLISQEPDGTADLNLRYDRGRWTGLSSLNVVKAGSTLTYTFDLAEVGWSGSHIQWFSETQAGVAGVPEVGIADTMPNTGFFGYVLREPG